MPISVRLHEQLAVYNIPLTWLAEETRTSVVSLRRLKNERARSIKFDLLDSLCELLGCAPGDLLVYENNGLTRSERRWKHRFRIQPPATDLTCRGEGSSGENAADV